MDPPIVNSLELHLLMDLLQSHYPAFPQVMIKIRNLLEPNEQLLFRQVCKIFSTTVPAPERCILVNDNILVIHSFLDIVDQDALRGVCKRFSKLFKPNGHGCAKLYIKLMEKLFTYMGKYVEFVHNVYEEVPWYAKEYNKTIVTSNKNIKDNFVPKRNRICINIKDSYYGNVSISLSTLPKRYTVNYWIHGNIDLPGRKGILFRGNLEEGMTIIPLNPERRAWYGKYITTNYFIQFFYNDLEKKVEQSIVQRLTNSESQLVGMF
jgi:hypothetical protein